MFWHDNVLCFVLMGVQHTGTWRHRGTVRWRHHYSPRRTPLPSPTADPAPEALLTRSQFPTLSRQFIATIGTFEATRFFLFFKFLASTCTRDRKPHGLIFTGVPKFHALFLQNICLKITDVIEIVCHWGFTLQVSSIYWGCTLQVSSNYWRCTLQVSSTYWGRTLEVSSTYWACDLQSGVTVENRGRRIACTEIFRAFTYSPQANIMKWHLTGPQMCSQQVICQVSFRYKWIITNILQSHIYCLFRTYTKPQQLSRYSD